ncbi:MAG: HAD family hydrolase [Pseudomonadota bacterium]
MKISGLIFDINGTLIDILTDEGDEEIYRAISHFLTYRGVYTHRWELKEEYFQIRRQQVSTGEEKFPEFDAPAVWREYLLRHSPPEQAPNEKDPTPLFLAEMYRGISRGRLELYPGVRELLDELRPRFKMAVLSDGQSAWALPELRAMGIVGFFDPIIVSGDFGYRKPDPRLFEAALSGLGLPPEEVLFVGNDMYHDVFGAKSLGLKTVFFSSNQGRKQMDGVEPDYIIYNFWELRQALSFFENR